MFYFSGKQSTIDKTFRSNVTSSPPWRVKKIVEICRVVLWKVVSLKLAKSVRRTQFQLVTITFSVLMSPWRTRTCALGPQLWGSQSDQRFSMLRTDGCWCGRRVVSPYCLKSMAAFSDAFSAFWKGGQFWAEWSLIFQFLQLLFIAGEKQRKDPELQRPSQPPGLLRASLEQL